MKLEIVNQTLFKKCQINPVCAFSFLTTIIIILNIETTELEVKETLNKLKGEGLVILGQPLNDVQDYLSIFLKGVIAFYLVDTARILIVANFFRSAPPTL